MFLLPDQTLNQVYDQYGLVPFWITQALGSGNFGDPVFFTLITSTFLHGGWVHVLGNMWYLWVFGDNVEDRLGHIPYLFFYLFMGIVGGMAQALLDPLSPIPVIGASGAVAGVLGAYLIAYPQARVLALVPIIIIFTIMELPAVLFLAIWFLLQLFNGVASIGGTANAVAWWAHVGGFVMGMLLIKLMPNRKINFEYNGAE